jgi:catechol 2,3-dioxygenase-like lactoylglutathione lyase family enzyme
MLTSSPIIAFVATTVPRRAKVFYTRTLGLKLVSEDDFAIVFDAGGTMLRVAIVPQLQPAQYTVLGWIVRDIRRAASALAKRRVKFQRYPGMDQDDLGIWTSPSGAHIAWFKDPDGNTLSLTEFPRRRRSPARTRSVSSAGAKKTARR